MRTAVVIGFVVSAFALSAAAPARSQAPCGETACGVPSCWTQTIRARPDLTRSITVACSGVTSARLTTPPANSDISNVTADWYGVHFDIRPHDGAPRWDEAGFEVTGHEGSIDQHVAIEVIPRSENSPPICDSDRVTQRSDGTGPVDVYLHPYCRDPDGDEFVIRGGPPGVHPASPKSVPAGDGDSNWPYRTATFAGDESTTIWATDVFGARSADARLDVTVGPAVERPPECRANYVGADPMPIYMRPGATRRFGLFCEDPDGDAFTASLSSPPERGAMAAFDLADPWSSYNGSQRWIDATYVPAGDSLEPDPFTVTASGAHGDGPAKRFAMTPRALPENSGGGCGWSGARIRPGTAGTLSINCDDDEGDPLTAEPSESLHGTVGPAVITPARYGSSDITIPYAPSPGYEGYDCVKVKVSDGHGTSFELTVDITVAPDPPVTWVSFPYPPSPPVVPPLPLPQSSGVPRLAVVRALVEKTLGTKAVHRLSSSADAQVWSRAQVSRHDLMRFGRAPGVMVVCFTRCRIRGEALATGMRSVRAARQKSVSAATAGQSQVLSLAIDRTQRRALARARKARAKFSVTVRAGSSRPATVRRSIPLTR